jgi:Zn-dependent protease
MYPVLCDNVSIGTFCYEGSDTKHYFIANAEGDEFEISRALHDALLKADGTKPLDLPDKGRSVLPELQRNGLVSTSRFVKSKGLFNRFILFQVGSIGNLSVACRIVNAGLSVMSILLFAIGVFLMSTGSTPIGNSTNWWLCYGLFIISLACHEAGHFMAGVSYGYRIHDVGVLLIGVVPLGAYVAHEDKKDATKVEKLQFALAGIEMNLLIAGICLMITKLCYSLSATMVMVANMNVILALVNLLPAEGLDGETALSALFGVGSISKIAKTCLLRRELRYKLIHSGPKGLGCFCIFTLTLLSKVILWLLIALDVASLFLNLF